MDEMESRLESRILMREEGTLTQEWDEKMTWSSQLRGWAQRWEAATAGAGRAVGGWGVESDPRAESLASIPPAFPPGWDGKKLFFLLFWQWHVGCSLPEKGSNPSPLHWKVDSLPLDHQGSTRKTCFTKVECELSFWLPSKIQKARGIVRLEMVTPNHSQRRHGKALPLLKVQKVYLLTLHKRKTSLLRTMIHSTAFS